MTKKEKIVNDLLDVTMRWIADTVARDERTKYTKAYKEGMITPRELIQNSKMRGLLID